MAYRLISLAAALALAGTAAAQRDKPSDAAKSFTLDGLDPAPTPTPTSSGEPTPAASPNAEAAPAAIAAPVPSSPPVRATLTLDTPIQDLIADPGAKAVLDKDLPGVSDDEHLDKFKALSLRSFQPLTGGQMTDAMLAKVAADLEVLAGGTGAVTAPVKVGNGKRRKDDSR